MKISALGMFRLYCKCVGSLGRIYRMAQSDSKAQITNHIVSIVEKTAECLC